MEGLTNIGSVGIRVLLGYRRALSETNCEFAICSTSETVRLVFEINGFDRVMTIYSDLNAKSAAKLARRTRESREFGLRMPTVLVPECLPGRPSSNLDVHFEQKPTK